MDYFSDSFLPNIKNATITYARWRKAYPGESSKWDAYVAQVQAHEKGDPRPAAPALSSRFGRALVAAAEEHVSVIDLGAVWEPPVPPVPDPDPDPSGDFPGLSPDGIAMSGDLGSAPTAADYAAGVSIGFKVMRKEMDDTKVLALAQRGIMALPLVYGQGDTFHGGSTTAVVNAVNRWSRGVGTLWTANPSYPTSIQPVWFEIGNEPYLNHEGMWPTVANWAQGWLASATAAKNANPLVKVLLPVGLDINGPQGWRPFTDYVLDAAPGIATMMDGWSCHPYCPGRDPATYTNTSGGSSDFQRYNYIRQKLAARGVNKPWCISEFGFHTDALSGGVTEQQQADFHGRAYDLVVSGGAGGMPKPFLFNYYTIKDYGDGSNQEHNFGFHFRRNGTIKPASAVIQGKAT